MWVQPILVKYLSDDVSLTSDPIYKFDWIKTTATLPVDLNIVKAFNRHLTASVGPESIANGPSQGNWSVKAAISYLHW